jgi:hypothetical protein
MGNLPSFYPLSTLSWTYFSMVRQVQTDKHLLAIRKVANDPANRQGLFPDQCRCRENLPSSAKPGSWTSMTVSWHRPSSCRSQRSCNILIVRSDRGVCPVIKSFSRYFVILQFMDIIVIHDILHPESGSFLGEYLRCSGRV